MKEFPCLKLIELLPSGAVVLDDRGGIVAVNRAFERLTGHRGGDLLGRPALECLALGVAGLEDSFREGVARGSLDVTFDVRGLAEDGSTTSAGMMRLRAFDDGDRTWALGVLEAAETPDGRLSVHVEALVDRVSTTKHAINNLLMGLMGHAEILSGLEDVPASARARGEAILDQSRRLREEVQKLDLRWLKQRSG